MGIRRTITAAAFEHYLQTSDAAALLAAAGPEQMVGDGGLCFPEAHRILDFNFRFEAWRVVRVVDAQTGETSMFLEKILIASAEPGVPYSLKGDELLAWVRSAGRMSGD